MNKIRPGAILVTVFIGLLSSCRDVGVLDVRRSELVRGSVEVVADEGDDVIRLGDCEGWPYPVNSELDAHVYYKLGIRGDVNIGYKRRVEIWDLLCNNALFVFDEFSSVADISVDQAVRFAYYAESFLVVYGSLFDEYVFGSRYVNVLDKAFKVFEVDGFPVYKLPMKLVEELLYKYFGNADIRSYKNYGYAYDISKDGFVLDYDGVRFVGRSFYPFKRINNLRFVESNGFYTIVADYMDDHNEVNQEDGVKSEKREYVLKKHRDGSLYFVSMRVLDK